MKIFVDPMGAPRQVRSDAWRPRDCVLRYRSYRDAIRHRLGGYWLTHFPENVSLRFTIAMPMSWSDKKKNTMRSQPHRQKPDIDNLQKGFLDSVFRDGDDAHVWRICAEKVWGDSGSIEIL